MFTQLKTIILMVVILACPMWCCVGQCHDANCCPSQSLETACCEHCSQADCNDSELPGENNDSPSRRSNQSTCQGVCGGAVLAKTCELDEFTHIFNVTIVSVDDIKRLPAERLLHQDGNQFSSGNHGRFLRTLHESFLC